MFAVGRVQQQESMSIINAFYLVIKIFWEKINKLKVVTVFCKIFFSVFLLLFFFRRTIFQGQKVVIFFPINVMKLIIITACFHTKSRNYDKQMTNYKRPYSAWLWYWIAVETLCFWKWCVLFCSISDIDHTAWFLLSQRLFIDFKVKLNNIRSTPFQMKTEIVPGLSRIK